MKKSIGFLLALQILLNCSFARAAIRIPGDELTKLSPIQSLGVERFGAEAQSVFLYFWASWCPDCRDKLRGSLAGTLSKFPQIKLITVNLDRVSAKGEAFAKAEGVRLPVFRDESKELSKKLEILAVPSWALLTRAESGEWIVSAKSAGSDLEDIEKTLKEKKL